VSCGFNVLESMACVSASSHYLASVSVAEVAARLKVESCEIGPRSVRLKFSFGSCAYV
jgi:hypothetical protein